MVQLLKKWVKRISFSLLDQGLYSGSNFIVNILLVRWLSIENYGAFGIIFTTFLILSSFYNALLLEPMSVLGAGRFGREREEYLKFLLLLHIGFTIILLILLGGVAVGIYQTQPTLGLSLLGLSLVVPLMLLFWMFRQSCYLYIQPGLALKGSSIYATFLILGIVALQSAKLLTPFSAFIVYGVSSIVSVLFIRDRFFIVLSDPTLEKAGLLFRKLWPEQWRYGKWVAATAVVYSLSTLIYPIFVGFFLGLADAGVFRAMQNLILPLQQVVVALVTLFLPPLIQARLSAGFETFRARAILINVFFLLGAMIYAGILLFKGDYVLKLIYSTTHFDAFLWMLPYWAFYGIIITIHNGFTLVLRALERPNIIFYASCASTLVTLSVGVYVTFRWQLLGAMVSMIASSLIAFLVLIIFLIGKKRTNQVR